MTPRHDLLSLLRICSWSYFQLKICVDLESWPFTFNLQSSLHPARLADVNTISIATLSIFLECLQMPPFCFIRFFPPLSYHFADKNPLWTYYVSVHVHFDIHDTRPYRIWVLAASFGKDIAAQLNIPEYEWDGRELKLLSTLQIIC